MSSKQEKLQEACKKIRSVKNFLKINGAMSEIIEDLDMASSLIKEVMEEE